MNIFLVDYRGGKAKARARARIRAKSKPGKPGIVELDLFRALSLCAIASLGVKNLFDLQRVTKLCQRFFQQANILE